MRSMPLGYHQLAKGDTLLEVKNVSLAFGGVKAIQDVSVEIRKGEIRAIIGPNGAGKTSMLNVINGFYHPQEGEITFKGVKRKKMRPHEAASGGIARTFQNVALFKSMTTLDNIMAGRSLKMNRGFIWQLLRYGPAEREEIAHRRKVEEIIDFLEIQHIRRVPVGRLPYGLQKRVELGRALAMEPKVLLLDEPFGALDALTRAHLQDSVMALHQKLGNTVMMITHDVDEAVLLSDRIVMMTNGPAAKIGEILELPLARPRKRLELVSDAAYTKCRAAVLKFLYERHRYVEAA